jgi:hypothetical protein
MSCSAEGKEGNRNINYCITGRIEKLHLTMLHLGKLYSNYVYERSLN